ncbi:MAG: hypothetical protein IPG53_06380 [Ignavibacteriales bacterium]|nr:hypothetical protein [Ignavibacteriales bacterium]
MPLRREPRENTRQPHTRTENTRTTVNREKEPVAPVEEKEPVVRQERVTKEPVTRNEPREREITPRPDNRDRDRNSGRRKSERALQIRPTAIAGTTAATKAKTAV